MSTRPSVLDRLDEDFNWSPRQRQLLDLLARGDSKAGIAGKLGVSLAGAKWHVREVMSKLGVDSRDEAAEYWRAYNGWRLRFTRMVGGIAGGAGLNRAIGSAAVAFVVVVAAIGVVATLGGDEEVASPGLSDTPSATGAPTGEPSPTALATPSPVPTLAGLFTEPRETTVGRTRTLGPVPDSQFPDWDGTSTVIYDFANGTYLNLGTGSEAYFSPDSTKAVWVGGMNRSQQFGEAMLIDLSSGEVRSLGPARITWFVDNEHVLLASSEGSEREVINLRTGDRRAADDDEGLNEPLVPNWVDCSFVNPDGQECVVYDPDSGEPLFRFRGVTARQAPDGELVIAIPADDGRANVFILDVATRGLEFVATTEPGDVNWPISANEEYVVWTENYCGTPPGQTFIYSRATDRLVRVDDGATDFPESYQRRWVELTPGGLVAQGPFNPYALYDPESLEYVTVAPGPAHWSSDYRLASHGFRYFGDHGGLCP